MSDESKAAQFRKKTHAERVAILAQLGPRQKQALKYYWPFWARPNQLSPEGLWRYWLIMAGRGWGKSRTGSEFIRERVSTGAKRIALVGKTAADVRDVMIEGESGLLSVFPPWQRPKYEPSKRRVTFHTGATATLFASEAPDLLRGPQQDTVWCDELAAWNNLEECWYNLRFSTRKGDPRFCITTTPRPVSRLKWLVGHKRTVMSAGHTKENMANLADEFVDELLEDYEGTSIGDQELCGLLLSEIPGALWTQSVIDAAKDHKIPTMPRIVVGVDPAATPKTETGIVVMAGNGRTGVVLADETIRGTTEQWAMKVVQAFHKYGAERVAAERNQGGDMVRSVIHAVDPDVPVDLVWASKGKHTRAQPVAMKYEQGKIMHADTFTSLEDEMTCWVPDEAPSPNRLDALVWAAHAVVLSGSSFNWIPNVGGESPNKVD